MTVNEESLGFRPLVGQIKEVTLRSVTLYRKEIVVKIIGRLFNNEDNY